ARAALIEVVTLEIAKLVEDNKTLLDKTKTITKRVNKLRLLAMAAEGASWLAGVPTFGAAYKAVEASGDGMKGKADLEYGEAV
ncbi:NTPase KAP, partial [Acinetobacter baumannii]|nr:NTPase KAP [Acinetobacter baumannii]